MEKLRIKTICCDATPFPDTDLGEIICSDCKESIGKEDILSNPNVIITKVVE